MKNLFKKQLYIAVAFIFVVVAVSMILGDKHDDGELRQTSLRLKWINQAQFAGYYMAAKNGFYKDANLDVAIEPAGPNISSVQLVANGTNEFGVTGADQLIEARSKGVPVVALAVLYRENPEALISLKEKGIKTPKDLVGKKVAVIYGNDENIYDMFLRQEGINRKEIKEVAAIPGVTQLLSGDVDAKMAYEMNDPVLLELAGKDVNVIKFRDYGIKFYADTLFTTEDMIKKNPGKVRDFVRASLAGWEAAIANPEEAAKQVVAINPSLKYDHQLGYLEGSIPIITQSGRIGVSDRTVWENMRNVLAEKGTVRKNLDVKAAYTNDFIEQ